MGLTLDRGRYYWVKNVPKHIYGKVLGRHGQPVRQIRQALRTADLSPRYTWWACYLSSSCAHLVFKSSDLVRVNCR